MRSNNTLKKTISEQKKITCLLLSKINALPLETAPIPKEINKKVFSETHKVLIQKLQASMEAIRTTYTERHQPLEPKDDGPCCWGFFSSTPRTAPILSEDARREHMTRYRDFFRISKQTISTIRPFVLELIESTHEDFYGRAVKLLSSLTIFYDRLKKEDTTFAYQLNYIRETLIEITHHKAYEAHRKNTILREKALAEIAKYHQDYDVILQRTWEAYQKTSDLAVCINDRFNYLVAKTPGERAYHKTKFDLHTEENKFFARNIDNLETRSIREILELLPKAPAGLEQRLIAAFEKTQGIFDFIIQTLPEYKGDAKLEVAREEKPLPLPGVVY